MTIQEREDLLATLRSRFEKNPTRHEGLNWDAVRVRLERSPASLEIPGGMESTGGEPDVIGYDAAADHYVFCDCAPESPTGRRSLCFDASALSSRKEHKPRGSALEVAAQIGIAMLTEEQYHGLQRLGAFNTKTSSWLATPDEVRALGGALFGDRRYGRVFIYCNGAESYYAARGFRGLLRV